VGDKSGSSGDRQPITYSARGKQYVAVSVGNALAVPTLNHLAEELNPGNASNVFVFALP
jgi:hypothetical protein